MKSDHFSMVLSTDPNREINDHANVFLPPCKTWVFDWAAKVSIVTLHGKKIFDRVNVNFLIRLSTIVLPLIATCATLS